MTSIDQISGDVLDVSIRLHRELGPGLLESVYETILAAKLSAIGYRVERQRPVDIAFEEMRFPAAFRIDLLVDERVLVEVKSVETLAPVHKKQLLTYLRLSDKRLGLLINFHVTLIKDGITRVVNGLEDNAHAKPPNPPRE